jgi:hypothetical protein
MEVAHSWKIVDFYQTIQCYIPEDNTLHRLCFLPTSCKYLAWLAHRLWRWGSMFETLVCTRRYIPGDSIPCRLCLPRASSCSFTYSSSTKMEAVLSSEVSVAIYQTTCCYIWDNGTLCRLFATWILLVVYLAYSSNPEDGSSTFVRNIGGLCQTTRCYITEDSTLHTPEKSAHKIYFACFLQRSSK